MRTLGAAASLLPLSAPLQSTGHGPAARVWRTLAACAANDNDAFSTTFRPRLEETLYITDVNPSGPPGAGSVELRPSSPLLLLISSLRTSLTNRFSSSCTFVTLVCVCCRVLHSLGNYHSRRRRPWWCLVRPVTSNASTGCQEDLCPPEVTRTLQSLPPWARRGALDPRHSLWVVCVGQPLLSSPPSALGLAPGAWPDDVHELFLFFG